MQTCVPKGSLHPERQKHCLLDSIPGASCDGIVLSLWFTTFIRVKVLRSWRVRRTVRSSDVSNLLHVDRSLQLNVRNSSRPYHEGRKRIINSVTRNGYLYSIRIFCLYRRTRRFHLSSSICSIAWVTTNRLTIRSFRLINVCVIGTRFLFRMITRVHRASQRGNGLMSMTLRSRRRTFCSFNG